jgi:tetratricopeptide (TPR) repeat protein
VLVAQLWGRSSRAHTALNNAIECQRRGDYETAAGLFQEALSRQDDLTPQEREELARLIRDNTQALQARQQGTALLRQAEQVAREGHTAQAAELVKKAAATEQYLTGADQARLAQLSRQLVPSGRAPGGPIVRASAGQVKSLVAQSRAEFQQGNWEYAEALAREAEQSGASFSANEDSPRRILEDLDKAHKDRKALLGAARAAMGRGDFDLAEMYVHEAEQVSSGLSMPWSDSPAKVLKEIQTARSKSPAPQGSPRLPAKSETVSAPGARQIAYQTTATSQAPGNMSDQSQATAPTNNPAAYNARALVQQARVALNAGDLVKARRLAEQASALRPILNWSEDTPEKVLNHGRCRTQAVGSAGPEQGGSRRAGQAESQGLRGGQARRGHRERAAGPCFDNRSLGTV